MTITYILGQNLKRNPLRSCLTTVAFALPMAIFVAAISFVVAMVKIGQANEQNLRLVVRHKATLTNTLPEGLRRKIEALDPERTRLRAVCGMRWFGGRVPDTKDTLTSLATDHDTFPIVYSDLGMTEDDIALWMKERTAAVVGLGPAERYGWKPGDRVTLESTVPPYLSLEFRIVKVVTNPERANYFFFRRDYLDESLNAAAMPYGRVNTFWIKSISAESMHSLQTEIDALFANSPDETKSEDENAFIANFIQAAGDIPGLMRAMALMVVFIIVLVAGNTMMMSFRERTRELAVFKAMGFQSRRIFGIVIAESVLLAFVGSLLGVVPTTIFLLLFPSMGIGFGPISRLDVSPIAVVGSVLIALGVGLLAGLWPAFCAMRLRTVDALRKVA
ncbi:MAG: ABC transporter permease [Planctomycetota bacterium]